MSIEIDVVMPAKVKVQFVRVHMKIRDEGTYILLDQDKKQIVEIDNCYVPSDIIPGSSDDYIDIIIDIETGQIVNWKKPSPREIKEAFFRKEEDQ